MVREFLKLRIAAPSSALFHRRNAAAKNENTPDRFSTDRRPPVRKRTGNERPTRCMTHGTGLPASLPPCPPGGRTAPSPQKNTGHLLPKNAPPPLPFTQSDHFRRLKQKNNTLKMNDMKNFLQKTSFFSCRKEKLAIYLHSQSRRLTPL